MSSKKKDRSNRKKKSSLKEVKLVLRIVFGIVFFILGFNTSKTAFFVELPFFGYHTIIEVLISVAAAAFGFFVFPMLLVMSKNWIEELVFNAVSNIVAAFWDQQSGRIQNARRQKQRSKAEEKSLREKRELERAVILDTSVLVDGRILDIVKIGFFDRPLVIPQNVISELQKISDSKNKIKRTRGRMGLDVVKDLKKRTKVLMPDITTKEKAVDKQLVMYAKDKKLKLMTLDFNLNKVAKVSGIKVLNINSLVNSLKTVLLPGEELKVKVIQKGKEKRQGVGYLPDGTMVIIEKGIDMVGKEVTAKVTKVIQTPAGKIIFSTLKK